MTIRVLDAYCCQGGASRGYHNAGLSVSGVDICPQPRYPYAFTQGDAVEFILLHGHKYDLIHASPPCQRYSATQRIMANEHPDLIAATRAACAAVGTPYVIENVVGARSELRDPIELCGAMFPPLRVYRHRLFEASFPLAQPEHPQHIAPQVKMGRRAGHGEWLQVVGNFSGVAEARKAMGMPWASRDGLREAIPPAYAEYVGRQFLAWLAQ